MLHECKCPSPRVLPRDRAKFYIRILCVQYMVRYILKIVLDRQEKYKRSSKMGRGYEKLAQRGKRSLFYAYENL